MASRKTPRVPASAPLTAAPRSILPRQKIRKLTRSSQRSLQRDRVLLDTLDRIFRNGRLSILEDGRHVDFLPLDRSTSGAVDRFDGFGDFGTDTVTGDQGDGVVALFDGSESER